jgi:hypothetical protein
MRVTRRDSLGPIEVVRGDAVPTAGAIAARETPEGYLLIEGRINGCGVYRYEDAHGDAWGELRLPEHVGAPATVDSWDGRVPTDDHPPVWLDATNTREYQRGTVTRPRFESAASLAACFTRARILVMDAELIGKIYAGKCELSCGYDCVLVQAPGHLDGQAYDYIQTEIRGNHVAIVDRARGGPMCALIFDAASCRGERPSMSKTTDGKAPKAGTGSAPPTKRDAMIMIGDKEFEVPDEVAAEWQIMQAKMAEHESMMGDARPEEEKPMDSSEIVRLRADLERERGRSDALAAKVDHLAKAETARELDALRERVRPLVPRADLDGLDALVVKRRVLLERRPDLAGKLDAASPDYIDGAFEAELAAGTHALARSALEIIDTASGSRHSVNDADERRRQKIAERNAAATRKAT